MRAALGSLSGVDCDVQQQIAAQHGLNPNALDALTRCPIIATFVWIGGGAARRAAGPASRPWQREPQSCPAACLRCSGASRKPPTHIEHQKRRNGHGSLRAPKLAVGRALACGQRLADRLGTAPELGA